MDETGSAGWILKAIADGLAVTPEKVRLGFFLISAFVFLLIVTAIFQKIHHVRRLKKRSKEVYGFLSKKFNLIAGDHELVKRLALYLGRGQRVNLLLLDEMVFDGAAEKLLQYEPDLAGGVRALRKKLHSDTEKTISDISSRDIPVGRKVVITRGSKIRVNGVLVGQDELSFTVQPEEDVQFLVQGDNVRVFFHTPDGVFVFSTRLRQIIDKNLVIEHSHQIVRFQRRRFFRREASIPIWLKMQKGSEDFGETRTLDISGGGLSVKNSLKQVRPGDLLSLQLQIENEEVRGKAKVLRITDEGSTLHLMFTDISEASRDRIMKAVLSNTVIM